MLPDEPPYIIQTSWQLNTLTYHTPSQRDPMQSAFQQKYQIFKVWRNQYQDGRHRIWSQASEVSILEGSKASMGTESIQFSKAVDFFSLCFKTMPFEYSCQSLVAKFCFPVKVNNSYGSRPQTLPYNWHWENMQTTSYFPQIRHAKDNSCCLFSLESRCLTTYKQDVFFLYENHAGLLSDDKESRQCISPKIKMLTVFLLLHNLVQCHRKIHQINKNGTKSFVPVCTAEVMKPPFLFCCLFIYFMAPWKTLYCE